MITDDIIKQKISELTKLPVDSIEDEKPLTSLVADSFVLVELMLTLQEEYSIFLSQDEMENILNIRNLLDLIRQKHTETQSLSIA